MMSIIITLYYNIILLYKTANLDNIYNIVIYLNNCCFVKQKNYIENKNENKSIYTEIIKKQNDKIKKRNEEIKKINDENIKQYIKNNNINTSFIGNNENNNYKNKTTILTFKYFAVPLKIKYNYEDYEEFDKFMIEEEWGQFTDIEKF